MVRFSIERRKKNSNYSAICMAALHMCSLGLAKIIEKILEEGNPSI